MIDLPNVKWLRSPKMPEYAVCFDPANGHFLWVFKENPDGRNWTSVRALNAEELVELLQRQDPLLEPFKPVVQQRLDELHAHLRAERERGERARRETYGAG